MLQTLELARRATRLRSIVALSGLLALFAGACNSADNLADPSAVAATLDEISTDSLPPTDTTASLASARATGIPFGPFGLWRDYTSLQIQPGQFAGQGSMALSTQNAHVGPGLFNASITYTDAYGIIKQINAARAMRQKVVLAMTGGPHWSYQTRGRFDFWRWQARMNTYKTAAIKAAVAAGVADGTIIGNTVMDEPEIWGGITKPMINQMASYVKGIFPTLPVGVDHGPNGYYQWRPWERYTALDYVMNQYNWWVTTGNVVAWRDKVLAQARRDGVQVSFGLNVLGGGIHNWTTKACPMPLTGGRGPYVPTCRMTANQVRDWGLALGTAGCALFLWEYDRAFMLDWANAQAFRDVAARLASSPARSCRRP
jgi:hypothetical protein